MQCDFSMPGDILCCIERAMIFYIARSVHYPGSCRKQLYFHNVVLFITGHTDRCRWEGEMLQATQSGKHPQSSHTVQGCSAAGQTQMLCVHGGGPVTGAFFLLPHQYASVVAGDTLCCSQAQDSKSNHECRASWAVGIPRFETTASAAAASRSGVFAGTCASLELSGACSVLLLAQTGSVALPMSPNALAFLAWLWKAGWPSAVLALFFLGGLLNAAKPVCTS